VKTSDKDLEFIWHPYTQMKGLSAPINIVKGEGARLIDEDGNAFIDAISSWWVNTHGHAHPHIAAKIHEQAKTLEHSIFAGFTHPKAVELAERLLKVLPSEQKRIFYSDNGSTAVEVAIKMAIQFWDNQNVPKQKLIAFNNAYHGDTFGAMAVSGRGAFVKPFDNMLFDVEFIDVPVPGHENESLEQLREVLEHQQLSPPAGGELRREPESGGIAAFIYEPLVQGAAGMVMHEPHALDALLDCCKQHNIITIADEVMTGFGRTGKWFASHHLNNQPDIMCMSKGITGGTMALGATSCSTKIFDAFLSDDKSKTLFHGHSFTGNPIACAAACASMDLFDEDDTWSNIKRIENRHRAFMKQLKDYSAIKEVRMQGTIIAIELETGNDTSYFNAIRDTIYDYFIGKKILLRPLGNIIYILPPYCITDEELDQVYGAIIELLENNLN